MAKVELKEYGYAGKTAEEVVSAWKRNVLLARVFAIVVSIAVIVAMIVWRGIHSWVDVLLTIVFLAIVLLFAYGALTREFLEVQKILTTGCDPKLLRKVLELRLSEQLRESDRENMGVVCAQAAALAGDGEAALAMVKEIEASSPKEPAQVLALNARATVARQSEDLEGLRSLREQVATLQKKGGKASAMAGQVLDSIDIGIALCTGNYDEARGLANKLAKESPSRQAAVAREFAWAQACEREGVLDEAYDHYAFVAEKGGTLNAQQVAAKWVKSHKSAKRSSKG